ncbi:MAG: hypothetical protein AAB454_02170 [Patescibacteria group bacterium]
MNKIRFWLQENKKKAILCVLILLICAASFGLGYLLAKDFDRAPIIIENN